MEPEDKKLFVLPHHRNYKPIVVAIGVFALLVAGGGAGYWYATRSSPTVTTTYTKEVVNPQGSGLLTDEPPTETFVVDDTKVLQYDGEKVSIENSGELPVSESFAKFIYDKNIGKVIGLSGMCRDAYYTVVIFNSTDDYRKDPAKARFNRAFDCPLSKKFTAAINLKDFNLPTGEYYFLVADQGTEGTWYNPR